MLAHESLLYICPNWQVCSSVLALQVFWCFSSGKLCMVPISPISCSSSKLYGQNEIYFLYNLVSL